jgi:endonuclease YncB( thermonuclease family)
MENTMQRNSNRTIKAILVLSALCMSATAQPRAITGKVVGITDGDTITVLDANKRQHKIRLTGIDAPESNQDFSSRSKQSLSELVFGKTVTVISSGKEHRGRTLGKVMLSDGKDINLEQVERGMAWFYRQYAKELSREDATLAGRASGERREDWLVGRRVAYAAMGFQT